MRKFPLLLIIFPLLLLHANIYGQNFYFSISKTEPHSPEVFKASYSSSPEVGLGLTDLIGNRFFYSVGFGYFRKSLDSEKLLDSVTDTSFTVIGGDLSYFRLQTGLGYIFMKPSEWIYPYLNGALAVGVYTEDPIFTSPDSEYEIPSSGGLRLRTTVGVGIQTWPVMDILGVSLGYEFATLFTGESRGAVNFSAIRLQIVIQ